MEGIYLAAFLEDLKARLPARVEAWAFPEPGMAVLVLEGLAEDLAIVYRPGEARLEWRRPRPAESAGRGVSGALTQALARRARGVLERAEQVRLDRVAMLAFSGARGFVDEPPCSLVLEATGHRASLLVLDQGGKILQASAPGKRQLRGNPYRPPAVQPKLDPRYAERGLIDQALRKWRAGSAGTVAEALIAVLDGVGAVAADRICGQAGLEPQASLASLSDGELAGVAMTAKLVAANPGPWPLLAPPPARVEPLEKLRYRALAESDRRLRTARARLGDSLRAIERAAGAEELKAQADRLILEVADRGSPAAAEAQALYQRYKRRRAQAEQALAGLAERQAAVAAAAELVDRLRSAPAAEVSEIASPLIQAAERRTKQRLGRVFEAAGFEVLVGRGGAENERLTFEVASPRDLWLHALGHAGSHVIVRSGGKSVPREVVLVAASLAAYYSKARGHTKAEVQVARVSEVRRVKGGGAGRVKVLRAETVTVRPSLPDPDRAHLNQES